MPLWTFFKHPCEKQVKLVTLFIRVSRSAFGNHTIKFQLNISSSILQAHHWSLMAEPKLRLVKTGKVITVQQLTNFLTFHSFGNNVLLAIRKHPKNTGRLPLIPLFEFATSGKKRSFRVIPYKKLHHECHIF